MLSLPFSHNPQDHTDHIYEITLKKMNHLFVYMLFSIDTKIGLNLRGSYEEKCFGEKVRRELGEAGWPSDCNACVSLRAGRQVEGLQVCVGWEGFGRIFRESFIQSLPSENIMCTKERPVFASLRGQCLAGTCSWRVATVHTQQWISELSSCGPWSIKFCIVVILKSTFE